MGRNQPAWFKIESRSFVYMKTIWSFMNGEFLGKCHLYNEDIDMQTRPAYLYAKPITHPYVRMLVTIPVSKINLIHVFKKIRHYFINKCVALLTNEYFRRFGTFNLLSASRSWQSDCYSKREETVMAQFKNRFGNEKNVKVTKYFSTVGWILHFLFLFHLAVGILPFITFPIFTWIILFPSLFLLLHSVVFVLSPWNSTFIRLGI